MAAIPNFWDIGPHDPIPVEATWREFVKATGGQVVEELVPEPRTFQNADFLFPSAAVVAELKEIETEFNKSESFKAGFNSLMERVVREDPDWRPVLFGGSGELPKWFTEEFVRLFRPPISRILKKRKSTNTRNQRPFQNSKCIRYPGHGKRWLYFAGTAFCACSCVQSPDRFILVN